jgi:hypothetical protein
LPHAELDREARGYLRQQHLVAVALRLRLEQLPARHRYIAHGDASPRSRSAAATTRLTSDLLASRMSDDRGSFGPSST